MADYATYCATKFGVIGFTEALADEMDADKLGVVAVCPGQVNTPLAWKTGVAKAERSHLIQPESVARVIAELAGGRRRVKNGEAVDVRRLRHSPGPSSGRTTT